MRDKPTTPERDLPPPCLNCRSLHKQYGSSLCEKRRTSFFHLERLRALPPPRALCPGVGVRSPQV